MRILHARQFDEHGHRIAFAPLCGADTNATWDDNRVTCKKCLDLLSRRRTVSNTSLERKVIQANQYLDPALYPYEVLGFWEDYVDMETHKSLGCLDLEVDQAPCALGSDGRREAVLTETIELKKGFRTVKVKASPSKPRRVMIMVQVKCGRLKEKVTR